MCAHSVIVGMPFVNVGASFVNVGAPFVDVGTLFSLFVVWQLSATVV